MFKEKLPDKNCLACLQQIFGQLGIFEKLEPLNIQAINRATNQAKSKIKKLIQNQNKHNKIQTQQKRKQSIKPDQTDKHLTQVQRKKEDQDLKDDDETDKEKKEKKKRQKREKEKQVMVKHEKQINELSEEIKHKDMIIRRFEQQITLQKESMLQKGSINSASLVEGQSKTSVTKYESEIQGLNAKIDAANLKLQAAKTLIQQHQKQITQKDKQFQKLKAEFQKLKTALQISKDKNTSLQMSTKELKLEISNLQRKLAQEIQKYRQLTQKLDRQAQRFEMQTNGWRTTECYLNSQISNKSKEISDLEDKLKAQSKEPSMIRSLFPGPIFEDDEGSKAILISHIQSHMSRRIIKTRLIYQYDKESKANFHLYIDDRRSVALVIKTKKGALLAGYYPGVISEKDLMIDRGLIISISNDESYKLSKQEKKDSTGAKKANRAVVYDKYFIIFGNAEIRIKTGQNKIFSNFGINNACYDNRKKKVHDLLMEEEQRETELEAYEFHEVVLEDIKKKEEQKNEEEEEEEDKWWESSN